MNECTDWTFEFRALFYLHTISGFEIQCVGNETRPYTWVRSDYRDAEKPSLWFECARTRITPSHVFSPNFHFFQKTEVRKSSCLIPRKQTFTLLELLSLNSRLYLTCLPTVRNSKFIHWSYLWNRDWVD